MPGMPGMLGMLGLTASCKPVNPLQGGAPWLLSQDDGAVTNGNDVINADDVTAPADWLAPPTAAYQPITFIQFDKK